ncbi:hypothetical protein Q4E40_18385 [Pontibacter sp. BT731]|uniref:hypothetical protein n=1 Tax=Pontibacter coccineus TaxID=3063328 RepID=UPI0026E3117A|nr:hypothetical protein [Pontibacter sp. BT731]MDO6392110.1 hypothetical protein [Pontibacter sp. BT731]
MPYLSFKSATSLLVYQKVTSDAGRVRGKGKTSNVIDHTGAEQRAPSLNRIGT